ncbi:hypothetical protein EC9_28580 [Rosistilla ulvae]|uniref:Uncharacterized protein n=1 Tax=Rosistilla ulvae TaxID=1930277 RepID=A0A517M1C0_9BACT|nr:hypothetical protein EC9_28580 [Rosistilla ulvae]
MQAGGAIQPRSLTAAMPRMPSQFPQSLESCNDAENYVKTGNCGTKPALNEGLVTQNYAIWHAISSLTFPTREHCHGRLVYGKSNLYLTCSSDTPQHTNRDRFGS